MRMGNEVRYILITGAMKTGTSTACAICSTDKLSHIFYDVDFSKPSDLDRNRDITAAFPESAVFFSTGVNSGIRDKLEKFEEIYPSLRKKFPRFLGVKVPSLTPGLFAESVDLQIVLCVRDIRTWLCKNSVIEHYFSRHMDVNIVPTAIEYAVFLLSSFECNRILRLRMEDLPLDDGKHWPRALADFLDIESSVYENWWERRDIVKSGASYSNWPWLHESAFLKPRIQDTEASLLSHPFWDALLPIFDKYYRAGGGSFSREEISEDKHCLTSMLERFEVRHADIYEEFMSFKIVSVSEGEGDTFSVEGRGLRSLGKATKG